MCAFHTLPTPAAHIFPSTSQSRVTLCRCTALMHRTAHQGRALAHYRSASLPLAPLDCMGQSLCIARHVGTSEGRRQAAAGIGTTGPIRPRTPPPTLPNRWPHRPRRPPRGDRGLARGEIYPQRYSGNFKPRHPQALSTPWPPWPSVPCGPQASQGPPGSTLRGGNRG